MLQLLQGAAGADNAAPVAVYAKGKGRAPDEEVLLGLIAPGLSAPLEAGMGQALVLRCEADAAMTLTADELNDGDLVVGEDTLSAGASLDITVPAGGSIGIAEIAAPPPA